jgi:hypothetical protein
MLIREMADQHARFLAYIDGAATSQPVMFVRPPSLSNVCPTLGVVACSGVTVTFLQVSPLLLRKRI